MRRPADPTNYFMNEPTTAGLPLFDNTPNEPAPAAKKKRATSKKASSAAPADSPPAAAGASAPAKKAPKAKKKAATKKKVAAKKKSATKKAAAKKTAKAEKPAAKDSGGEKAAEVSSPAPAPAQKAPAPVESAPASAPAESAAQPQSENAQPAAKSSDQPTESRERDGRPREKRGRNRRGGQGRQNQNQNQRGGERNDRNGERNDRNGGRGDRNSESNDQNGERGGERNDRRKRRRKKPRGEREPRQAEVPTGPPIDAAGLLEISNKGFGFLRQTENDYQQNPSDVFVTPETVRTYGLRDGMWIKCIAKEGHRGPQLIEVLEICGKSPDDCKELPFFEELTAINPCKKITLETTPGQYTTRVIDLVTPLGRGQRGLIVAPPRTGKTTILQHMAEAVHKNHENMIIFVLLVDERPEEVTELRRALPFAEIMASSNDQDVKSHTRIAQIAIERCKRLVEAGEHVFLLLDSITRLARAFNNAMKGNNRGIQKGGMAVGALEIPRRLFAAARNTREAGSLTIIGTALVETNSSMDEGIFQEFKGTGNMELVLDRKIAEQYVWPAVNIHASGTRREELLLAPHQLDKTYIIRRGLAGHKPIEAIQRILSLMERFKTNAQLLIEIKAQH
ncbi:MAG: transcription termination factor Rho [Verrucomicrobiales bacterium]|jgi:transcription termination factor Rho